MQLEYVLTNSVHRLDVICPAKSRNFFLTGKGQCWTLMLNFLQSSC